MFCDSRHAISVHKEPFLVSLHSAAPALWKIKNLSHVSLPVWLGVMRLYHMGSALWGPAESRKWSHSLRDRVSLSLYTHVRHTLLYKSTRDAFLILIQ